MNKKSIFSKIMIIIIVSLICLALTFVLTLLFGSTNREFFDFSQLNISNMLPIIIIGCFLTCVVVGILVLFLAKDVFIKIKNYFFEKNGGNEK